MVSTLVVGTNTYQLQAAADTTLGDNIATSAWSTKSPDQKAQALITAFYLMEAQVWKGSKTGGAAQVAQHPRNGLTNCNGDEIDSADIAPDIVRAQALLAFELVTDPTLATSLNTDDNTKKLQAGSASIEFFNRDGSLASPVTRFPGYIMELLKCYLASSGSAGIEAIGATGTSLFDDDCDDYDRNLPF